MPYFKGFSTEQEAKGYSRQEAIDRGCEGVTQYWWEIVPQTDGTFAVVVDAETEGASEGELNPIQVEVE